jgi:hypothetical protein
MVRRPRRRCRPRAQRRRRKSRRRFRSAQRRKCCRRHSAEKEEEGPAEKVPVRGKRRAASRLERLRAVAQRSRRGHKEMRVRGREFVGQEVFRAHSRGLQQAAAVQAHLLPFGVGALSMERRRGGCRARRVAVGYPHANMQGRAERPVNRLRRVRHSTGGVVSCGFRVWKTLAFWELTCVWSFMSCAWRKWRASPGEHF